VHYPKDRDSDPHVTGLIWSRALWDIHQAIGRLTADHVFLEGNFLMPFSPTLRQAAQAMLQADRNLTGGANQVAMLEAFQARGLVEPRPTLTVTSPDGGERWPFGQARTITWNSSAINGQVQILLSRNGGNHYTVLFDEVPNTGSIRWRVWGLPSSQCRIQIRSISDPGVEDTSNEDFSITLRPWEKR
jgi:hypothetical protein